MKIKKIKIKKITLFLEKLPRILSEKAFLTFFALLLLIFIFSGYIFYQYAYSVAPSNQNEGKVIDFQQATYKKILNIWKEKAEKFEKTNSKRYPDLFYRNEENIAKPLPQPEPETEQPVEETEEGTTTEEFIPASIEALLATENLTDFYLLKDGFFPSEAARAAIWEEKGLGPSWEYYGSKAQNQVLLEALKKELTE